MAQSTVISVARLDAGLILAPERYDPRRSSPSCPGVPIGELAQIIGDTVAPALSGGNMPALILDTGDAQEGVIRATKRYQTLADIGSAKKRVQPGDVIISRLRPYLRQVAFVDAAIFTHSGKPAEVVCSTEFYVLRARDEHSFAFVVPFLLSAPVQKQLAAAQEGGHHPRFNHNALRAIVVPASLLELRNPVSAEVERAVTMFRQSEQALIGLCTKCVPNPGPSERE